MKKCIRNAKWDIDFWTAPFFMLHISYGKSTEKTKVYRWQYKRIFIDILYEWRKRLFLGINVFDVETYNKLLYRKQLEKK